MKRVTHNFTLLTTAILMVVVEGNLAAAHNNKVSISQSGGKRCISSNGLPDHRTGSFPNRGNPHRLTTQNVRVCVTNNPRKGKRAQYVRGSIGIGTNGVQFRPTTADYYDPTSKKGFSRNRKSGWNLDGLGARQLLGMDQNNAHVDERGLYHYHGIAKALANSSNGSLIGWAADGFEIHYVGRKARSSYQLKKGSRPSGPGGAYDGTYVQDWQYVAGSGSLDQCNGGMLNGKFVYFATDRFPYLPHCLWGQVSADFLNQNQTAGTPPRVRPRSDRIATKGTRPQRQAGMRKRPPRQAVKACRNRSQGTPCRFHSVRANRTVAGQCLSPRGNRPVCIPNNRP